MMTCKCKSATLHLAEVVQDIRGDIKDDSLPHKMRPNGRQVYPQQKRRDGHQGKSRNKVCSSITKWMNHAVFLFSVTAVQIRKLVGGEQLAAPVGGNRQTSATPGRGNGRPGVVAAELWPIILYFGIHLLTPPSWPPPPPKKNIYSYCSYSNTFWASWKFLGSASVVTQTMRQESAFSRKCMWTHAQRSSSKMSGNCGSLPQLLPLLLLVPFYAWYFLQERRVFLSTVVTSAL